MNLKDKIDNKGINKGDRYKHFKGGIVEIDCLAIDTDNYYRRLVIYHYIEGGDENLHKNRIWARSLDEFTGYKIPEIKRFTKIK